MNNYQAAMRALAHAKDGTVSPQEAQVLATIGVGHAILALLDGMPSS
jgi:hypothetical protein